MVAPDPRAFPLHKLWLSRQPDREPIKRKSDMEQALAVGVLVLHYPPYLKFAPEELKMFTKFLMTAAAVALKARELPPGNES
jgi:hypothetical protein